MTQLSFHSKTALRPTEKPLSKEEEMAEEVRVWGMAVMVQMLELSVSVCLLVMVNKVHFGAYALTHVLVTILLAAERITGLFVNCFIAIIQIAIFGGILYIEIFCNPVQSHLFDAFSLPKSDNSVLLIVGSLVVVFWSSLRFYVAHRALNFFLVQKYTAQKTDDLEAGLIKK